MLFRSDRWTNSTRRIMDVMLELYDRIIDKDLTVRRVTLVACNLIPEGEIPADAPEQLDLFTDYAALEKKKAAEDTADEKERRLQKTALLLQQKFGKNVIVKGMNLQEGATTILRNGQIGGHAAGDDKRVHSRRGKDSEHDRHNNINHSEEEIGRAHV